jgi:hypothetical protein
MRTLATNEVNIVIKSSASSRKARPPSRTLHGDGDFFEEEADR